MNKLVEKYSVPLWCFVAAFWFFMGIVDLKYDLVNTNYFIYSGLFWVFMGIFQIISIKMKSKKNNKK